MNFLENITFRRNRSKLDVSNPSDDDCDSVHSQKTTNSISYISDDDLNEVQKLKERVLALETELQVAKEQIEILSEEKNKLQRFKDGHINDNICNKETNNIISKKGAKNDKKNKIEQKCERNTKESFHPTTTNIPQSQSSTSQKKICIISTNKNNKILSIAENNLRNYSRLCHYLKPEIKLKGLLLDIETKLTDFTMNDFCIILIGDEDFKTTENYFSIISYIRETLQKIQHTNIIICFPTYKYGRNTNMFNWRVESFNNLLYLDIITHEHAYILDSNDKLEYNFHMFKRFSGSINDYGMRVIFMELQNQIDEIEIYNKTQQLSQEQETHVTPEEESLFFRE